jgi:tripartite-type tricarboxylate transporter receptor subunit TctC
MPSANRLRRAVCAAGALGLLGPTRSVLAQVSAAQKYPDRPVRIVVPFVGGGALDAVARDVGRSLMETLGQPFYVDNKPGANSVIGTTQVAKSPPDGYTLLVTATAFLIVPSMARDVTYDPIRDFVPVSNLTFVPQVLMVNASSGIETLPELIRTLKSKPGELSFGSGGLGTSSHMAAELLARQAGVKMIHVPYKGNAPALVDLLGGRLFLMFDNISSALGHIRSGKLKALGVTSTTRFPLLPDVPAIGEILPGYQASIFQAVFAPAGTPADIVEKLRAAVVKFTNDPANRERYKLAGTELVGSEPGQLALQVRSEMERWTDVVKRAGIKAD